MPGTKVVMLLFSLFVLSQLRTVPSYTLNGLWLMFMLIYVYSSHGQYETEGQTERGAITVQQYSIHTCIAYITKGQFTGLLLFARYYTKF